MPLNLKQELESTRCSEFAKTTKISRKPKPLPPLEATPNIVIFLDVMKHEIRNESADILVMVDHGNMLMLLKKFPSRTALVAFHRFNSRWISFFGASTYVLVDRGSNLAAELMRETFREDEAQLCLIPTEAQWEIGLYERSHRHLYKRLQCPLFRKDHIVGCKLKVLLVDVEGS